MSFFQYLCIFGNELLNRVAGGTKSKINVPFAGAETHARLAVCTPLLPLLVSSLCLSPFFSLRAVQISETEAWRPSLLLPSFVLYVSSSCTYERIPPPHTPASTPTHAQGKTTTPTVVSHGTRTRPKGELLNVPRICLILFLKALRCFAPPPPPPQTHPSHPLSLLGHWGLLAQETVR